MAELGYAALVIALLVSIYSACAFVGGSWVSNGRLLNSARNGFVASLVLVSVSVGALLYSLLARDFSIAYVADYASRDMSAVYLISSVWAGNGGSLLIWAWLLAVFGGVFLLVRWRSGDRKTVSYASGTVMIITAFFLVLILATANPFLKLTSVPADGTGLNPLLENPGMLFHPITLLAGYVGLAIPFAIAIGALASGRLDEEWVGQARLWGLVAWLFLSVGNLIGAWWAYVELGWGGYWAWDPVENASLMPWLVATALLHSLSMQRRKGTFRMWSMLLAVFAFLLTIFGTFLTRSNVLSSVHAFPETGMGPFFVSFMVIAGILSIGLVVARKDALLSEGDEESVVSREGTFLLNNLLLVGSTLVILLGTTFPLFSQLFAGRAVEVGKAFFNRVNGPLFLLVVVLAGICTTIGWRKASGRNLLRNLLLPALLGVITVVVVGVFGTRSVGALFAAFVGSFLAGTVLYEGFRGVRGRVRASGKNALYSLYGLVASNRSRYGGFVVHLGIAIMAVGITWSSLFPVSKDVNLRAGDSVAIGKYTVTLDDVEVYSAPRREGVQASLSVSGNSGGSAKLTALKFYDPRQQVSADQRQWVTEVAIKSTPQEDLYVILISWDSSQNTAFKILINPLVMWIWIGGIILVSGGILAFWPEKSAGGKRGSR